MYSELSANVGLHSVAETMLEWLGSLWPSIIPSMHYADALEGASSAQRAQQLVAYLPALNYRCFHYVAAFLRARIEARVTASGADDGVDDDSVSSIAPSGASASELALVRRRAEQAHLAALFGPTMLRPTPPQRPSLVARRRAALFLSHFLVDVGGGDSDDDNYNDMGDEHNDERNTRNVSS